jgi:hypothetical protein
MGLMVVVDKPNHTAKTRRRWVSLAQALDKEVECVIMEKEHPNIHAYRRVKSDSRGYDYEVWYGVATRIEKEFEWPTTQEDFNKIIDLNKQEG